MKFVMETKEITDKETWESFLLECKEKTFLSSWNWGEFQKKEGNNVWRLGIYNDEQLAGTVLVVKIKARRGTFLFVPHGPNINEERDKKQVLTALTEKLKEIAENEKASFIRISPVWKRTEENIDFFKNLGYKNAPIHMHPEVAWELDIASSEGELLMNMRKTTRYLIRQAQKDKNIEIVQSSNMGDLEKFNEIYLKTVQRHRFVPFSESYFKNQFSLFSPDGRILIFLGKYKNEVVSSAIIVYWQNMAFYHHGASLSKYSKIPVSYLLQWEAIKEAKKRGCQIYNFWGIAPNIENKKDILKSKHPWAGLTLFKMGFGGFRKEYVKTQDLILSSRYYLTYFFERIRKIKRGL